MKILNLTPILWTEQVAETISFYTGTLGFTCGNTSPENDWAALTRDTVEIMVSKPNAHDAFDMPRFTGSLYIRTDDVEAIWKSLQDKVRVVYAPETFPWGMREFGIYDNNGYILQFGQDMQK